MFIIWQLNDSCNLSDEEKVYRYVYGYAIDNEYFSVFNLESNKIYSSNKRHQCAVCLLHETLDKTWKHIMVL